jgi:response regulator of citrate/malate metabolism
VDGCLTAALNLERNHDDLGTMTTAGEILEIDDVNEIGESVYAVAAALEMSWVTINNKSALQAFFSPDTALILFDPKLQKKDGTEVIRFLGEQQCKARIVLMSGCGSREI